MRAEFDPDGGPRSTAPGASAAPVHFNQRVGQDQAAGSPRPAPTTASSYRGWAPLKEACAADLKEAMDADDTARIPPLVKAVADFALIERGAIGPGSRRAQRALRIGRLSLARRLIARHLSKSSLSPTIVADLLGVSVRYLHVLFETTGTSFSQTVAIQRMHESRRLLGETPPRPIAEIAHACGFGSLATFYRIFNASEGLTPGEFRARAGGADASLADTGAQQVI